MSDKSRERLTEEAVKLARAKGYSFETAYKRVSRLVRPETPVQLSSPANEARKAEEAKIASEKEERLKKSPGPRVFITSHHYDYEGGEVNGVHNTLEEARRHLKGNTLGDHREINEWHGAEHVKEHPVEGDNE